MKNFKFNIPIQVRYGDLDPQWHVNNARFLTFLEQARFQYLVKLGLFSGENFFDVGLIVADIHIKYRNPIEMNQNIEVGAKVTHIGNKSLKMESVIADKASGEIIAEAETVMVGFDYHSKTSIPISDHWRAVISEFEGVQL